MPEDAGDHMRGGYKDAKYDQNIAAQYLFLTIYLKQHETKGKIW